ncbi:1,4-dihydroxy-2-naphthoate polyprenyltransferase [Luteipulveratus halotolerans]|uniref:1,4-dihydroxy-2-naphthoate octaprenyltransferase n=1 Tax=Luteipulveratus halotolerans TaxID=1631356 RepID=A0A0L6CED3_9MICO|nr:1,4-dihydroxy-2-naphthoate polyprenyltransferase [Luteipulveratus halotolerans]KNX36236.1 1,4-dihydroxy-2-naphthoate prenyltransferase [Luteipulveratus halotolerans]
MATLQEWVQGARPRTLPAAIAPVAVGTGLAYAMRDANPGYALLALVVSLALQVGVNYANDYSDGIRGTDDVRVGPVRLVGQRLAQPGNVKLAAFLAFGVAGLAGLTLITLSNTPWLLLIGALAIIAAWKYTGGKNPYGYLGLGEVFVFIFFGLVAVLGTTYTQTKHLDGASWASACGVGAIACAVLVANNLRDIPGDTESGKRTLAVRLGDPATRVLYVVLVLASAACVVIAAQTYEWAYLGLIALLAAVVPVRTVVTGRKGRDLIPALAGTGMFLLAYGVLLGLGLYLTYRLA